MYSCRAGLGHCLLINKGNIVASLIVGKDHILKESKGRKKLQNRNFCNSSTLKILVKR